MQPGFFDDDQRLAKLRELGDPLPRLNATVDWEAFRPQLEVIHQKPRKSNAGRKPHDVVLMFKLLVLQSLYNLSDDQVEFQVRDRLSFQRFLGLYPQDVVPDAKTLWLFRERLTQRGLVEKLFYRFDEQLAQAGFSAKGGQIIDASLVAVPKNRNSRTENAQIKAGEVPEGWDEQPAMRRQKDTDARWVKKHEQNHYGYKNHITIDRQHKVIRRFEVTDASVHDSQVFEALLDDLNPGRSVWADSAYRSQAHEALLEEQDLISRVHHKAQRNQRLTTSQKATNKRRSRIRARVEHVFGAQTTMLGRILVRTKGTLRAAAKIGMMNLAYNMRRLECLLRGRSAQVAA